MDSKSFTETQVYMDATLDQMNVDQLRNLARNEAAQMKYRLGAVSRLLEANHPYANHPDLVGLVDELRGVGAEKPQTPSAKTVSTVKDEEPSHTFNADVTVHEYPVGIPVTKEVLDFVKEHSKELETLVTEGTDALFQSVEDFQAGVGADFPRAVPVDVFDSNEASAPGPFKASFTTKNM